jgi:hypothetical protein
LYIERAIAPLIFAFAALSLVLSSMQVVLLVPVDELGFGQLDAFRLQVIRRVFWAFPIILLLMSSISWILLLVTPFSVVGWQLRGGSGIGGK